MCFSTGELREEGIQPMEELSSNLLIKGWLSLSVHNFVELGWCKGKLTYELKLKP